MQNFRLKTFGAVRLTLSALLSLGCVGVAHTCQSQPYTTSVVGTDFDFITEDDATAFSDEGLIVLYSDNASARISTHDLEETVFHESIHAAWDKAYARSPEWQSAQAADGAFVTNYARKKPELEDLAESALFACTLLYHPERIPTEERSKIESAIPARIQFIHILFNTNEPTDSTAQCVKCDGANP